MDVEVFVQFLLDLFPPGIAWVKDLSAKLPIILWAIASEFSRANLYVNDLLNETDPRTTTEFLQHWEKSYGLPDACEGVLPTVELRRNRLLVQRYRLKDPSLAEFEKLFLMNGYEVSLIDFKLATTYGSIDDFLYDEDWANTIEVASPGLVAIPNTVDGFVNEFLVAVGEDALECFALKTLPAHAYLLFTYGE